MHNVNSAEKDEKVILPVRGLGGGGVEGFFLMETDFFAL